MLKILDMSYKDNLANLRSGVPVCLVKDENIPYLHFDSRHSKKALCTLEDIHQQILLAKFHENLSLLGGDDSIFELFLKIESTLPGEVRFS